MRIALRGDPRSGKPISVEELCDALVDLVPERRELWLRIEATNREQEAEGLVGLFKMAEQKGTP